MAPLGKNLAGKRPKAPLHAVADDGVADFLCNREPGPNLRVAVGAVADEEHESGSRRAPSGVRGQEVGTLLDYA